MKTCPLKVAVSVVPDKLIVDIDDLMCRQNCAWFDESINKCAVLSLIRGLALDLKSLYNVIQEK